MRHRLFVVGAQRRQLAAHAVQRRAEPGDIAVAEDREHAAEQRDGAAVMFRHLCCQKADDCFRGGEAQPRHL